MHPLFTMTLMGLMALGDSLDVYRVDDLSREYYGEIYLDNPSEVFSEGWIAIHERKSGKQLIKVEASQLYLTLHEGKPVSNITQFPYGEFSVIIEGDFNFDGKSDFAIQDGHNSCYRGPSYKIFLGAKKGFAFSKAFTQLAQEYCGMFQSDTVSKTIGTFLKEGCCYHEYFTFIVKNNKPKLLDKVVEGTKDTVGE